MEGESDHGKCRSVVEANLLDRFRIDYPVAVDSDYAVWQAFHNNYWPAVYVADASGRIRHHQYGEGEYEHTEAVIQQLLREAGYSGIGNDGVSLDARSSEVPADWDNLRSQETYLGHDKAEGFASPGRNLSRNFPPADIKILSSNGVSSLAGMWETNTSKASFDARLNVASGAWNHAEVPLTL